MRCKMVVEFYTGATKNNDAEMESWAIVQKLKRTPSLTFSCMHLHAHEPILSPDT